MGTVVGLGASSPDAAEIIGECPTLTVPPDQPLFVSNLPALPTNLTHLTSVPRPHPPVFWTHLLVPTYFLCYMHHLYYTITRHFVSTGYLTEFVVLHSIRRSGSAST